MFQADYSAIAKLRIILSIHFECAMAIAAVVLVLFPELSLSLLLLVELPSPSSTTLSSSDSGTSAQPIGPNMLATIGRDVSE